MDAVIQFFVLIFWFVVILVPLVAIHEFGHFFMSRINRVKIPEFAIGMPLVKRTFYKRKKGVIWSFYWPLLGGFVRIYGDNDAIDEAYETAKKDPKKAKEEYPANRFSEIISNRELQFFLEDNHLIYDEKWDQFACSNFAKGQESDSEKDKKEEYQKMYNQVLTLIEWEYQTEKDSKNTLFRKNWFQQTLILAGGVLFNLGTAVVVFWIIFTGVGFNDIAIPLEEFERVEDRVKVSNQKDELLFGVVEDGLADKAGLNSGDKLISLDSISMSEVKTTDDLVQIIEERENQEVEIIYYSSEDQETKTVNILLEKNEDGEVRLGVRFLAREMSYKSDGFWNGFGLAWDETGNLTARSFRAIGDIFAALMPQAENRDALEYVGGPIAVSGISASIFERFGLFGILQILASVSIALAVFNMLPIPALDGGRWVIMTISKITGKRNRKLESTIVGVTFILLMILSIVIAINDIQDVIGGRFNL